MRAAGDRTPVLMLTARAEVSERVAGLEAGADDYLAKVPVLAVADGAAVALLLGALAGLYPAVRAARLAPAAALRSV